MFTIYSYVEPLFYEHGAPMIMGNSNRKSIVFMIYSPLLNIFLLLRRNKNQNTSVVPHTLIILIIISIIYYRCFVYCIH